MFNYNRSISNNIKNNCLFYLVFFSCSFQVMGQSLNNNDEIPPFFKQLPNNKVLYTPNNNSVVKALKNSAKKPARILIPRSVNKSINVTIGPQEFTVLNESFQYASKTVWLDGVGYSLEHTQGKNTAIGELKGNSEHWFYQTTPAGTWITNLNELNLSPPQYANDTTGLASLGHKHHVLTKAATNSSTSASSIVNEYVIVDILLLFTPNIQAKYPGELSQTLLNHLIARANQAMVNSGIKVQLRLVGIEFVNYTKPSSLVALDDIQQALDNQPTSAIESSLANLSIWREQTGADIVAMIRTHDLNEREVCGVAMFPSSETDILANVSNVGISGGSNCINTFTHEIGHNFGAGHQAFNGESQGALANSGALIVSEKFNTIMSSIGTGDENRNYKLSLFSNLTFNCGGQACGNSENANNAATVEAFALQNASLREPVIPIENFAPPVRTLPDADGDLSSDDIDAFPFLASEQFDTDNDGVGDNLDVFPNDPQETLDTDNDGIGNNQDNDDDNDNVSDVNDALPLDSRDFIDADGDGIGESLDELEFDFRESQDNDNDSIGNMLDEDDDNDGVNDFSDINTISDANIIIVSADSNQLLEFDAQTGDFVSVAATMPAGSLTFRSDVAVSESGQVYFIAFSDVYRLDRQTGDVAKVIDRSRLVTNFPVHLSFTSTNTLIVNNGLGFSALESFEFTSSGTNLTQQIGDGDVYRDTLLYNTNELLIANRSANLLEIQNLNETSSEPVFFASNNLNKPEQLAVNSTGDIYVSNAGDGSIAKFSNGGVSMGVLVAANSNGLGKPSCLAIGPDQVLYVCSEQTNEVFKFNSNTGQFIGKLISQGEGGLSRPVSIGFVPKTLDTAPYDNSNDSDNDGVPNIDDALPLDPSETIDTDNDGIGNNADNDDDGDGMLDSFEQQFGFDPLNPADASLDSDGDGFTNLQEAQRGTNPNIPDENSSNDTGSGGGSMPFGLVVIAFFIAWFRLRRNYFMRLRTCL